MSAPYPNARADANTQTATYTGAKEYSDLLRLATAPPMSRQTLLRVMSLGFGVTVLLVLAAAYFGYQGSRSIQTNAQELVSENLLNTDRAATLEGLIEKESADLLKELELILGACFVLAVAGSALTIWITHRAFLRLDWQANELNQVSWHLVDGYENISRRFSHEMHDELGQALTGLRAMVRRLRPEDVAAARQDMVNLLDEVMRDVRELSQLLRPVILDDFGLDAGLRWLCERFGQRTGIDTSFQSNFSGRMADNLETHLFRIAQEALTNIARHSGASKAWVRLDVNKKVVTLSVEDNGSGIVAQEAGAKRPSLGMVGMRARVRQIQGDLQIESRPSAGLQVIATVPLRLRQESDEQNASRIS